MVGRHIPIERNQGLITESGVRELRDGGTDFRCRYDLVKFGSHGKPIYICVILVAGEERVLISERATASGVKAREFAIWPGLFNFHLELGDGIPLTFHDDLTISSDRTGNTVRGLRKTET